MKLSFNIQEEMAKCKNMEDIAGKNGLLKRMLKEMTEQINDSRVKSPFCLLASRI